MKTNFYFLSIVMFFLTGAGLSAQTYNEHDLAKVKAFMEQSAGGKRNIDILWDQAPATLDADGSNWVTGVAGYVKWNGDRLVRIEAKYKDLNGKLDLEGCTGLTDVHLRNNKLTEVNLKGCTNLGMLYVCLNQIAKINLEGCYNIREIAASSNQYTTIDLSNRAKLTKLYIPNNKLTSVNVKGCTNLNALTFTKGNVASIDLSDCVNLTVLTCYGNKLTSLDLSKSPKLKTLTINHKDASGSYVNPIKSLNISGCQQLETYGFIKALPDLETLNISNCGLSSLDLSLNKKLKELEAGGQLFALDQQEAKNGKLELKPLPLEGITVVPSDEGIFENGLILWDKLTTETGKFSYDFSTPLPAGVNGTPLSGTVRVPWLNTGIPVANITIKDDATEIYSADGVLYIRSDKQQSIRIFNIGGQIIRQVSLATEATFSLPKGIYVVQLGDNITQKVIVR